MTYCKTCGALLLDDNNSKCKWCKNDPNHKSKVQAQTIIQMFAAIIVAVVLVVGLQPAINTTVTVRNISNDMGYEEVVDVIVQALYVTSDVDSFFDAVHPKQLEDYIDAANMSEKEFKAAFRAFLLENNKGVISAKAEIAADNYDLTGDTLEDYTKNFNFFYGANIDAVKGVEVQVTITKENGETFTETANMVLVHQNYRWYLDADEII